MNAPEPTAEPHRADPRERGADLSGTNAGDPPGPLHFEIRNVRRGLDIEVVVDGSVVPANVGEVIRRVTTLVSRQPAQLWLDLRPVEIEAAAIEPLATGLVDAQAALAAEGGVLVVAAGEAGLLRRRLPGDLVRT